MKRIIVGLSILTSMASFASNNGSICNISLNGDSYVVTKDGKEIYSNPFIEYAAIAVKDLRDAGECVENLEVKCNVSLKGDNYVVTKDGKKIYSNPYIEYATSVAKLLREAGECI